MAKTKHTHHPQPYNAPVMGCPRCDEIKAEKEALGETQHNHNRLPFGRRLPLGQCPRCDELHRGAPPRETTQSHRERMDAEHAASIRAHFGPGHNERCDHMKFINGHWTGVCTFGDW